MQLHNTFQFRDDPYLGSAQWNCKSLSEFNIIKDKKIALSIVYLNTLLCHLVNLTRLVHFKLIYLCSTCFINDIFLELAHYVTSPSDHHPPHPSTLSTWRNRFPCVRPVSELLVEPWTWTHLCLLTIKCWGWGVDKVYITLTSFGDHVIIFQIKQYQNG